MENMKDRVTIYQVAKAAGVSLATVSRVINKRGTVTEQTRERVQAMITKLGYKPSGLAQGLATNRTTNIGVVIPSANYVYISNLLSGITETARDKNYVLTLFATSHSREEAIAMIEKVISTHVDGAIVFDDQLNTEDIATISSYNVPIVVIDNKVEGEKVGHIHFSYSATLRNLIAAYWENGGEVPMTFLHVHNAGRLLSRCERVFVETHKELGKPFSVINSDDSYTHTYHDFLEYFKKPENRKGFFIGYRDSLACAIMNAATDSGLSIPDDIQIVSLVGTKYSYIVRPMLSAMHIDMFEVGKRAMYMLTDLMNHDLIERGAHFDAKFVPGQSTKPFKK